jgi:HKD family nuclease
MNQLVQASCLGSLRAGVLLPQHGVIVGGTLLLEEFFQIIATQEAGELTICTPFIDEAFTGTSSTWVEMLHARIDLRVVTRGRRDATNAWSALRVFQWRSAEIWQCPNLHAKIYSFTFGGCGLALVGSHNLTRQGLAVNIEAGVLFKAIRPNCELADTVFACQEHVNRLVQRSRIFIGTNCWPRPEELERQEDTRE